MPPSDSGTSDEEAVGDSEAALSGDDSASKPLAPIIGTPMEVDNTGAQVQGMPLAFALDLRVFVFVDRVIGCSSQANS